MALREINLLDPVELQRLFLRRHLAVWTGCLLILLVLIGGFYLYQTRIVMAHANTGMNLEDLQTYLGAKIVEIRQVQEELDKMDDQQAAIAVITKHKPYSRILLHLAQIMNPDTWLSKMVVKTVADGQKGGVELDMTGFSFTNENLGKFISRLNADSRFAAVVLKYARDGTAMGGDGESTVPIKAVQFQILCNLKSDPM